VYNALVIKAVLQHWPLASVNDVKAPVELVQGYGFFYHLGFVVGGKTYNLYELEQEKVLKQWQDPRAHFVLNCASSSCPPIRPALPTGAALEAYLDNAAREFLSDPRNVQIDHAQQTLRLSQIFKWYQADFLNDLRLRGRPVQHGIVDYLIDAAPEAAKAELRKAVAYRIAYLPYDWQINRAAP
jgi:hypothetical protein